MVCVICTNDRARDINRDLLTGQTARAVANKFGLNIWSVRKHWKKHLPWKDRHAKPAETVPEKMAELNYELRRLMFLAEAGDEVDGPLKVLRERRMALELEARMEHLLGATHVKLLPRGQPEGDYRVSFENGRAKTMKVAGEK